MKIKAKTLKGPEFEVEVGPDMTVSNDDDDDDDDGGGGYDDERA